MGRTFLRILGTLASILVLVSAACAADQAGWISRIDNTKPSVEGTKTPNVSIKLVSERKALMPQADNKLAVVLNHAPGWHTYWRMPGDAGLATQFSFTTPRGIHTTPPRFTLPERLMTSGMMSFGYSGTAVFPFNVEVPRFPGMNNVTVKVHVEYLACKDICVPGEGSATIKLPIRVATENSSNAALVENADKLVPEKLVQSNVSAIYEENRLRIDVPPLMGKIESSADFLPLTPQMIDLKSAPIFKQDDTGSHIYLSLTEQFTPNITSIDGILIADGGPQKNGWAVELSIPLTPGSVSAQKSVTSSLDASQTSSVPLGTISALFFSFIGGLILNLMPCVFPVLSLKLLQLVNGSQEKGTLIKHGLMFTAGVLITMLVLSGTLIALRHVGFALGWGFQLQSAWVVAALILLFTTITLNLLGLFEFTAATRLADTRAAREAPKTGAAGSFATGILAVIVASPCTAPFMGAALGYAMTQSAWEALSVFVALGLGMALPWLLLCIYPNWLKWLPKPGPWMGLFKKVMAIPMLGAVLWLGWVLSKQIELYGMLIILCSLGATTICLWLVGRAQWGRNASRPMMILMGTLAILSVFTIATGAFNRTVSLPSTGNWKAWSNDAVQSALAKGHPVFVDFTAAWCVTCQANKLAVLHRDEMTQTFQKLGYVTLVGDWTNRDPDITDVLATFGRNGVPLYVIYRPDGQVEVLPELLTPSTVSEALKRNAGDSKNHS